MNHTLILGGRSYPLDVAQSVDGLEEDILTAARDGGRFVVVTLAGGSRLSCLVTQGVSIAIEEAAPLEFTDQEEPPAPTGRRLHAVGPPPSTHTG
ncbi:hypothetical protein ELQ92_13710 [Labedella populi]|uniref:Uncharacterized protein n=1 Tax=Labedella populi TaxID=2498850 RepID=A0A3S5CJ12_9MICO|nr:hypothetical protein [Labedella populi]RWZ59306.1 hypothetical protein ELQ92_13710 [Labedella populi]